MDAKWAPKPQNGIRTPSFCISHRDLSHEGLPKIRMCMQFWGTKKAPAGTPTTRTEFVKIKTAMKNELRTS